MISDTRDCFIYITLPGTTVPVAAGRYALAGNHPRDMTGRFVYAKSYLERTDAVALDPVELTLSTETRSTRNMGGIFGALRDASPDFWGRKLIEYVVGGVHLNELEYLLNAPDDRAGALGCGRNQTPPAPKRHFNQTLDLAALQETADAIALRDEVSGEVIETQIERLINAGTSMGGARPKAVVEDDGALWLAKFNLEDDRWNSARVEHAMLLLARACGLNPAHSRVVDVAGRDVLLVKRFDREQTSDGYLRARMISALTLLRTEDTYQVRGQWSYPLLAAELRKVVTAPAENAKELFRRMTFNALISNTDDHPRNHALLARAQDWMLSPAYDLTPTAPVSSERRDLALICGTAGRIANADNLLSQCGQFLLERKAAAAIIDQMEQTVRSQWHPIARGAGVSEKDCAKIAPAFGYPGFRMASTPPAW